MWYKNAIFYQALVPAFYDRAGRGTGTISGVTAKLDYLQWLGVDCIWLPPFFHSPLRDDGYDVADYRSILPAYGTMADLEELLDQAHKRGMKIITDLALNHTSSDHYWFQQSRTDPTGPYGDYYVWGDDPNRYPEIRVIFTDVETSNWAYDEVRGQYYFHRFYSHQPDLNYDCPAVHDEVYAIIRFWMDKGLDGFRLDAIPYLYERDGVGGESLPETHEFIRSIRALLDAEYPDAIMLAEANQPPEKVVNFFGEGNGDQFHMCFNFPLMPRIYQAAARGEAAPISEIMAEMPALPATAQWGTFLRNHDELTLEMVDDAERELMYAMYAPDPQMRAHVGISRRLAPLLGGDRNKLELFKALLLAMPGSPFIYYGDEIGMGENLYLPDRDSVRTPMQWSSERNAGFSTAEPEALRRPVIANERFGYQAVNVAAQLQLDNSLLRWFRELIQIRKAHPAFGEGTYHEVAQIATETSAENTTGTPAHGNPAILAFTRACGAADGAAGPAVDKQRPVDQHPAEVVLCVFNFADSAQAAHLDLSAFAGCTPVELSGGARFPQCGTTPWTVMLPPHGFYWFSLEA